MLRKLMALVLCAVFALSATAYIVTDDVDSPGVLVQASREQMKMITELRQSNPNMTKLEMYQIVFPTELKVIKAKGLYDEGYFSVPAFPNFDDVPSAQVLRDSMISGSCNGYRTGGSGYYGVNANGYTSCDELTPNAIGVALWLRQRQGVGYPEDEVGFAEGIGHWVQYVSKSQTFYGLTPTLQYRVYAHHIVSVQDHDYTQQTATLWF